jgi:hypothetical protein
VSEEIASEMKEIAGEMIETFGRTISEFYEKQDTNDYDHHEDEDCPVYKVHELVTNIIYGITCAHLRWMNDVSDINTKNTKNWLEDLQNHIINEIKENNMH